MGAESFRLYESFSSQHSFQPASTRAAFANVDMWHSRLGPDELSFNPATLTEILFQGLLIGVRLPYKEQYDEEIRAGCSRKRSFQH